MIDTSAIQNPIHPRSSSFVMNQIAKTNEDVESEVSFHETPLKDQSFYLDSHGQFNV